MAEFLRVNALGRERKSECDISLAHHARGKGKPQGNQSPAVSAASGRKAQWGRLRVLGY